MGEVTLLIREFGFPTLFCLWLMWRDNKRSSLLLETQTKILLVLKVMAKLKGVDLVDHENETEAP